MPRKRGQLSNEDVNCIRRNVLELDNEEIAKLINRTEETVGRYVMKNKLRPEDDDTTTILKIKLKQSLHTKAYWSMIKEQFTDKELKYFEDEWVNIMLQFREDMLHSEELQLKQYLTVDISMNRTMIDKRKNQQDIELLQKQLDDEYKKTIEDRDRDFMSSLATQIAASRASVTSYTNEYAKLSDQAKALIKDLKASRSDRIKRVEDSKTSWQGLLRMLEDENKRAEYGEEAELFKLAAQKSAERLAEPHEYADGQVDQPFLNVEYIDYGKGKGRKRQNRNKAKN